MGRTFVRRLIDLSKTVKRLHHYVWLSWETRSDIEWWYQFTETWNGVSILRSQNQELPDIVITSDASGRWGCGASKMVSLAVVHSNAGFPHHY